MTCFLLNSLISLGAAAGSLPRAAAASYKRFARIWGNQPAQEGSRLGRLWMLEIALNA